MIFIFLSSGLFLGWSLGANDAANIFGSAVGSRMVRFRTAVIVSSIFVIAGAVLQGGGASDTLGKLGAVSALAGAFTIALSAAVTVFMMTKNNIPVSTSQAIVGAIIGWNVYTGNPTDYDSLVKIVLTWILCPVLSAIFAVVIFKIMKKILLRMKVHLLKLDFFLRFALIVTGAFGAYSLGANNIANVMGVFVSALNLEPISYLGITLSGAQQLFLLGGVAISLGIITYSRQVMEAVGSSLMKLSSEAALVVVLAESLVLFVFSSDGLSNFVQSLGLPAIPLVPVSSSQAIVGAILGIGLLHGGREVKFSILGEIALGWILTPVIAFIIAFVSLFFVNNVFMQNVG